MRIGFAAPFFLAASTARATLNLYTVSDTAVGKSFYNVFDFNNIPDPFVVHCRRVLRCFDLIPRYTELADASLTLISQPPLPTTLLMPTPTISSSARIAGPYSMRPIQAA